MEDLVITIIRDYTNLPPLPENIELDISQIRLLNFNKQTGTIGNLINYGMFTSINPNMYPINIFYASNDNMTPAIIIDSHKNKYRINHIYWETLKYILAKSDSIFPKSVFLDKKHTWINNLINL